MKINPLSRAEIGEYYNAIMGEVRERLDATAESLLEASANVGHVSNWKNAEFCYLQIRRVCEYVAIAVLVAHNEFEKFRSKSVLKEWNADALFKSLILLNEHAFPLATTFLPEHNGPDNHLLEPDTGGLNAIDLRKMYQACSDRLHVGSLSRLLSKNAPAYDFNELREWNNGLVRLLNQHVLFLPEIKSVIMAALRDGADGNVHCVFADTDGPSVFVQGPNRHEFAIDQKI